MFNRIWDTETNEIALKYSKECSRPNAHSCFFGRKTDGSATAHKVSY